MAEPAPTPASADRNLLFGVLALQLDLIDSERFARACALWAADKGRPLADVLVEQGWLAPGDRADVDKLLHRKLARHGGDARASLAEVATDPVRQSLAGLDDADVRRSLAGLTPPQGLVLVATTAYEPGARERYTLSRLHATGGIGRVWLARDRSLGRDVALKELRPERAGTPAAWARFLKEAQVTGQLEHPGVVPIYEVGRRPEDQAPFYTMRFVRGRTLAETAAAYHRRRAHGEAGPLELRELLGAFVGVCNAVAYAHSRGVLHRDLKPQNVVLGDYGEVIVLDWGLARLLGQADGETQEAPLPILADGAAQETVQGQVLGTPAYMAPEQAEGRLDQLGPATDVYGLGAILYEVLCGKPPFPGGETTAVLRRVIHEPPPRPRQLAAGTPRALEAVCLKALAKEPARRYGTAGELAGEVRHWLAGEPVAAYPEPWPARLARWARRHQPLVAAAAALLLTAVAALAVGIGLINREKERTALALASESQALAAESQARRRTREALDAMSSQVIEDWLARRSQLEPAQRAFLEKALAYYEAFADESGQTEEVRQGVADAHLRVGKIRYRLGQHPEAEAAYRRARELFARLAADFPGLPQYRREAARSANNLGNLLSDIGRPAEAEAAYREALDLQKQLAAEFPAVPEYRHELATTQNNLGIVLKDAGRPREAEAAFREALALFRRLAADFPAAPPYREWVAKSAGNLGIVLAETNRPEEARAAYAEALDIQRRLAADFPALSQYRRAVARSASNLGLLLADTGHPREAEAAYAEALAVQKQLAAEFPAVPEYRHELARSANNLGIVLVNTGRPKEAEAAFRDAVALYQRLAADFPTLAECRNELANALAGLADLARAGKDHAGARRLLEEARPHVQAALAANPRQPYFRTVFGENRQMMAATLLELGDHAGAAEAAADLARVAFDPAGDAYKAAGFFARCVPLAEKDDKLPEARRKELAQSYADQALAMLRTAVARGYKDLANLKKDSDLDPLRGRDDFRKLLAEVEAATKPQEKTGP
jgi:serine/threonine-protein kinase